MEGPKLPRPTERRVPAKSASAGWLVASWLATAVFLVAPSVPSLAQSPILADPSFTPGPTHKGRVLITQRPLGSRIAGVRAVLPGDHCGQASCAMIQHTIQSENGGSPPPPDLIHNNILRSTIDHSTGLPRDGNTFEQMRRGLNASAGIPARYGLATVDQLRDLTRTGEPVIVGISDRGRLRHAIVVDHFEPPLRGPEQVHFRDPNGRAGKIPVNAFQRYFLDGRTGGYVLVRDTPATRAAAELRPLRPPPVAANSSGSRPTLGEQLRQSYEEGRSRVSTAVQPLLQGTRSLDRAIWGRVGFGENLPANANLTRQQFNQVASRLPDVNRALDKVFVAAELVQAGSTMTNYLAEVSMCADESIPLAERAEYCRGADEAAGELISQGMRGAVFGVFTQAFPITGAAVGTGLLSYTATRMFLENTEVGQRLDRGFGILADKAIAAGESFSDTVTRLKGGETQDVRDRAQDRRRFQTLVNAVDRGTIQLRPGVTLGDLGTAFAESGIDLVLRLIEPTPLIPATQTPPPQPPLGPGRTEPPPLVATVPAGSKGPCPDGSWPMPTNAGPAYSTDGPLKGDVNADFSPKPLNCREQPAVPQEAPAQQQAAVEPPSPPQSKEPWLDYLPQQRDHCADELKDVVGDLFAQEAQKGVVVDSAFIEANSARLSEEVGRRMEENRRFCEGPQIVDDWPGMLKRSGICAEEAEASKQAEDTRSGLARTGALPAVMAKPNEDAAKAKQDLDACLSNTTRQLANAPSSPGPGGPPAAPTTPEATWTPPAAYVPSADAQRVAAATPDPPPTGAWQPPAGLKLPTNEPSAAVAKEGDGFSTAHIPPAREGHVPATDASPSEAWSPPAKQRQDTDKPIADTKAAFTPPAPYVPPTSSKDHAAAAISDDAESEKKTMSALAREHAAEAKRAEGNCRQQHGNRFIAAVPRGKAFDCSYCGAGYVASGGQCVMTAEQAAAQCRQQYGSSFLHIENAESGYSCRYCEAGFVPIGSECVPTTEMATAQCQQQHGSKFLRVVPSGSNYICEYCLSGSVPRGGQCMSTARRQQHSVARNTQRYVPRKQYYTRRYVPRAPYYAPRGGGGSHRSGGMIRDPAH